MSKLVARALAGAVVLSFAAPVAAPAAPAPSLPVVERSLTADRGSCAATSYRAPIAGYVAVRLRAARGDWDLALRDVATRRTLAASKSFGAREVVQSWVSGGQRLSIRGCRRTGSASRAAVAIRLIAAKPPKRVTPTLVRIKSPTAGLLKFLDDAGYDVTENRRAAYADVVAPDAGALRRLKERGIAYETRIADLNTWYVKNRRADARYAKRVRAMSPLPTGRTGYRLPQDYQAELKQIVAEYGSLARPVTIGESFQGRPIEGVEIGADVNAEDGRPVYFVMATHHAREWPSAETAMEFAWLLVKGYGNDPRITDLLRRERVTVVPLINPDGFFASRMAAEDGMFPDPADSTGVPEGDTVEGVVVPFGGNLAYRRKNCNGPFPSFEGEQDYPCYYQWGVDPNRNYGQFWGGPGASPDPNTQVFRGDDQWSEPETQAVHEYSQQRPVTAMVTLHNVAALVLRPPGLKSQGLAPDENLLREVGDRMADATGYTSQYGWQLYDTTGTTEDWNYQAAGTLGYTIEIGPEGGAFHMPYETGVVKEWVGPEGKGGLREALLIGAEAAADPAKHSIVEGAAAPGTVLRLKRSFDTPTSPICTFAQGYVRAGTVPAADCIAPGETRSFPDKLEYTTTVPASGRYEWHVTPSSRPFVSGKYVPGEKLDRTDTYEPADGEEPDPETNTVERTFEVGPDEPLTELRVKLDWTVKPEDYDLNLYHVQPDGSRQGIGTAWLVRGALLWTAPGAGQNPNGLAEEIDVAQPPAGTYVAEIAYTDTSVANDWTLTVARTGQRTGRREATGKTEAWTLTCETPGGQVLETREIVVDRGERVTADLCGGSSATSGQEDQGAGPGSSPAGGVLGNRKASGRVQILTSRSRLRRGRAAIRLSCRSAAPCSGVLQLRRGKRVVGKRAYAIAAGRQAVVRVRVARRVAVAARRARRGYRVVARAGEARRTVRLLGRR